MPVTLRVGILDVGSPDSCDAEATWLFGHTERVTFREMRTRDREVLVESVLHVRCRHLQPTGEGAARCRAHGFAGPLPPPTRGARQPRRLGGDRFTVIEEHVPRELPLPFPPRTLPVIEADGLDNENPCAIAPCATADHKRGSACCRDLQIEILCAEGDTHLEALVRSRLSPYLCKVSRERPDAIEAELISACDYLDDAQRNCALHGRVRPDGRPAKPELCSAWPDDGKGLHPGCLWYTPPAKGRKSGQ